MPTGQHIKPLPIDLDQQLNSAVRGACTGTFQTIEKQLSSFNDPQLTLQYWTEMTEICARNTRNVVNTYMTQQGGQTAAGAGGQRT
jgi:hypothetical protein